MKKTTLILALSAILVCSGVPISTSATPSPSAPATRAFTHTMFAELGTELPCHNCHLAREKIHKVYTSNDYPFYYVSLVDFENDAAAERIDEFNILGYPTVWFEGGYRVEVGGYPECETDYRQDLNASGARDVAEIDLNLSATWLGNAQIDIDVNILNTESTTYTGHVHVYVTEVESTMGWNDTEGHPYTFPLLDYAFNQDISIASSDTWTGSLIWDGHNYNDGQGHDFGNIQYGNIQVIAVVFNSEIHQGFSDPPGGNPFDAYYVDDAAGVWLGTPHPPSVPSDPKPADGATNVDVSKDLSWTNSPHEDIGEDVYSDLYFGTTNQPPLCKADIFETKYDVGIMQFHTTYYWKIVAHDNHGQITEGPLWSFTTGSAPDSTPPIVTLEKPKSGCLYIQDNDGWQRLLSNNTLIIGKITIEANATDPESGIDRISFLIDGEKQAEITTEPYTYLWTRFSLPLVPHTISVVAYNEAGLIAHQDVKVLKLL
jgi:hypothetical protein